MIFKIINQYQNLSITTQECNSILLRLKIYINFHGEILLPTQPTKKYYQFYPPQTTIPPFDAGSY
jgi:hypothetical protein